MLKDYLRYKLQKKKRSYYYSNHYPRRSWGKKLKYLAAFVFVFTLFFMGAAIWGTVALVNQVSIAAKPHLTKENAVKVEEEIQGVLSKPLIQAGCLNQVQTLILSPTVWLTVPISTHINKLKQNCSLPFLN
jgi:hypothetical protein